MVIAAVASFFIFHGQEGATAILLYAIAERLEEITTDKSRSAIKELLELAPDDALLKTDEGYKNIPSREVKVREIIGIMEITSVPRTPAFVRGVINLRGMVIPVVELRKKFNMDAITDITL